MTEALSFEGIGVLYGYGQEPDTLPAGYVWDSDALLAPVKFGADSVDIYNGTIKTAPITARLAINDARQSLLLRQARYGRELALLTAPLDDSSTTLEATTGLTPGSTVYVSRETITIGTEGPSGTYTGCTRNVAGSTPAHHAAGAFLYDLPVFWTSRRVFYWRYIDGVWSVVWRGNISKPPQSAAGVTQIQISAKSALEHAKGKETQTNVTPSTWQGPRSSNHTDTTHKANTVLASVRCAQIGQSVTHIQVTNGVARLYPQATALLNSPALDLSKVNTGWPMIVISPEVDAIVPVSPTLACDYPYHPLTIFAAFAYSTDSPDEDGANFDVLGGSWSMGMRWTTNATQLAYIRSLIEATPTLRVDHFVVGYDGKREKIWPKLRDMAIAYGFVFATTHDGYTTFSHVRQATIKEAQALTPLTARRDELEVIGAQTSINDKVVGVIGGLPWRSATTVTLIGTDDESQESTTQKVDLATKRAERRDELSTTQLQDALLYRVQAWPGVQLYSFDDASQLTLGRFLRLDGPTGLVTKPFQLVDGTFTNTLAHPGFSGLLVSRKPHTKRAGAYSLEVANNHYSINVWLRLRAPSATVASVSGTTITIEQDGGYGSLDRDVLEFTGLEDYWLEVWEDDGELISAAGTKQIDSFDFDNDQIIMQNAFDVAPTAGQVLRLARVQNHSANPRLYVFVAGDEILNSEADVYG